MMGIRAEQKARTRAALKAAAQTLVQSHGADELSVAQITQAAGVAGGTFYVHFTSKDALLEELVADLNTQMIMELVRTFDAPAGGPKKQLELLAHTYLGFWNRNSGQVGLYLSHLARVSPEKVLTLGSQDALHGGLVNALLSTGDVEEAGAKVAATTIFAAWRAAAFATITDEAIAADVTAALLCAATWGLLTGLHSKLPTKLYRRLVKLRR